MLLRSCVTGSRYPFARYNEDALAVVQRALHNTFNQTLGEAGSLSVRLDVKEDEKAFYVVAELPGLSDKEVEVTFDDGVLSIKGEKKVAREQEKETWHIAERRHGSFSRQVSMPANVDAGKIEASFDKGVLTILVPKLPETQATAKKINIKSN